MSFFFSKFLCNICKNNTEEMSCKAYLYDIFTYENLKMNGDERDHQFNTIQVYQCENCINKKQEVIKFIDDVKQFHPQLRSKS